ncbi:MAG TPA: LysR family transcriptional regulator [Bryobacteraceae bacterium]|nr:LysR family transcriptional regulator [Bryobacteraceae bacterium]
MQNIDLRLLEIIRELHRTGSVSHAAQNLGLSQSAVSMSLARLRKHFNDPLFVRTSRGMEPTPYAEGLIAELIKATEILESAMDRRLHFDPLTSDRMFHLISTDIAQFTILPPLVKRLALTAPRVRINLRQLTELAPRLLESGEADLAIGLIPQMGAGFCQQRLFTNQFMCAMRTGHPRIKDKLTLEQFQSESHLSVTTLGTGYESLEKALETQKVRRHIAMRVPSYLGVGAVITDTDYLVIVPGRFGRILASTGDLKLLPLPFSFPSYHVTQNWHERYTQDPAQQWLRSLLANTFREQLREPQKVRRS